MQEYIITRSLKDDALKVILNDEGDYIIINPSDAGFADRYGRFLKWLDEKDEELSEAASKAEEKYAGRPLLSQDEDGNEKIDTEQLIDLTQLQLNTYSECVERIDALFGKGTIRKYFREFYEANPEFVPDEEYINDFIGQVTPAIEKAYDARMKRINSKYSRARRGKQKA